MSRVYRVVGVISLLFGAFVIHQSLELSYSADFGPGPGFFSFWLGVLVIVISLIDIAGTLRQAREPLPEGFLPDRQGVTRILYIIGAMVAALLLLQPLGFSLTILLFSVFLLRTLGRQPWWLTLILSVASSFGLYHLFWKLQVFLPSGFLGI